MTLRFRLFLSFPVESQRSFTTLVTRSAATLSTVSVSVHRDPRKSGEERGRGSDSRARQRFAAPS
jgi:hypothetical protein